MDVASAIGAGAHPSCKVSWRTSRRVFGGVSALLFAASTGTAIVACTSMPAVGALPMPGGWALWMAWMRMCGQTWSGAAASFLGMWVVMMAAMMLPSLLPVLWRYRRAIGDGGTGPYRQVALLGAGYFAAWSALGLAVYPPGVALAALAMRLPVWACAVPVATGVVVLVAGALQFSAWKARRLARCREEMPGRGRPLPAGAGIAWRHGLRLGLRCICSCANLTAILLAIGIMDLRAMAAVTVAITLERVAPAGWCVARAIGAVAVGAGLVLIAQAAMPILPAIGGLVFH